MDSIIPSVTLTYGDGSSATWYGVDESQLSDLLYGWLGDDVVEGPALPSE